MKIGECMTATPFLVKPDTTVRAVAAKMAETDTGSVLVGENDQLIGVVTDRDIALRAIGTGKGPDCQVRDVMTPTIKYCFEDEDLEEVARNMGDTKVRRLPVINRERHLVGIVSLGDLARSADCSIVGRTMSAIAQSTDSTAAAA